MEKICNEIIVNSIDNVCYIYGTKDLEYAPSFMHTIRDMFLFWCSYISIILGVGTGMIYVSEKQKQNENHKMRENERGVVGIEFMSYLNSNRLPSSL